LEQPAWRRPAAGRPLFAGVPPSGDKRAPNRQRRQLRCRTPRRAPPAQPYVKKGRMASRAIEMNGWG
jgi:hypothetical protein